MQSQNAIRVVLRPLCTVQSQSDLLELTIIQSIKNNLQTWNMSHFMTMQDQGNQNDIVSIPNGI